MASNLKNIVKQAVDNNVKGGTAGSKKAENPSRLNRSQTTVPTNSSEPNTAAPETSPLKQLLEKGKEALKKNASSDILKVVRKSLEDGGDQKETVLATLKLDSLKQVTLADIKTKIPSLEHSARFCFRDRSPADETLVLQEYLEQDQDEPELSNPPPNSAEGGEQQANRTVRRAFLYVAPKSKTANTADLLSREKFVIKVFEWVKGEDGVASRGTLQSSQLGVPNANLITLAGLRKQLSTSTKMSASPKHHRFCTEPGETILDEAMTFSDYLKLGETKPDPAGELASVQVFYKLNSPRNEPHKSELSDFPGKVTSEDLQSTGKEFADFKKADAFKSVERQSEIPELSFENGFESNKEAVYTSTLTEAQWAEILRNCGIMHGWIIDREKNKIMRAPKPSFRLRRKPIDDLISIPDTVKPPAPKERAEPESNLDAGDQSDQVPDTSGEAAPSPQALAKDDSSLEKSNSSDGKPIGEAVISQVPTIAIPSFQVNDDSRIDITVSSHEFETSMAKNDFSSHSTEASMSGGYGGFAASASAGFSKSSSTSSKTTNNTYQKTMIARYLLPRADIMLHSADLELTPELKAALDNIKTSKNININDLRKLYRDFGQLWCQRVTVGGRLQSTKIMTQNSTMSEQEQKEGFKMSAGLQVTTPFGGGGVKHSRENNSETSKSETNIKKDEQNVFEAVGGDTILAANPVAWVPTVADYRTWRVIDRDSLTSWVDAVAAMPGYESIRSWFMQAVPVLSKYIELPPSREIHLRFKVTAPTSQLSLSYVKKTQNYDSSSEPIYYLAQSPDGGAKPIKNILQQYEFMHVQIDYNIDKPMFNPQSYRAPVLQGYANNCVGDVAYGTRYNQEYLNTVWKVSAPFNEALCHGALVCIQTVPLSSSNVTVESSAATSVPEAMTLVVFRNRQSVFLPGLSDAQERHFWRIYKHGARAPGEFIKEGDEVYFAWDIKDQSSGFRDFNEDVFGRRRVHFAEELKDQVLYMKLPWPRFEPLAPPVGGNKAVPNSMVLTTQRPVPEAQKTMINTTVDSVTTATEYGLEDVRFRVDIVGNEGRGEVGDQLLKDLDQGTPGPAKDPNAAMAKAMANFWMLFFFLHR